MSSSRPTPAASARPSRHAAPAIANHPDALAVWEYLDRSIDPSVIGRTFNLEN